MTSKYQPVFGELPERLKKAKVMFKGARFDVRKIGTWEVVIHPGAVVILPLIDENHILMIKNERVAVGETLWELPAGTLEPGEHPQETAARELIEETGYSADKIELMLSFYTTPGFCNEKMFAYKAKHLKFVGQDLDENEKITVEKLDVEHVLQMVRTGEIHDGKTITTLLYFFIHKN